MAMGRWAEMLRPEDREKEELNNIESNHDGQ
jgi:hypothetical protein